MSNYAEVVIFKIEHMELMELRRHEKETLQSQAQRLHALAQAGTCGTLVYDGRILGVMGYMELFPEVFEVFIIPTIWVQKYRIAFVKTIRNYLDILSNTHPVKRIQTSSLADDLHSRWMSFCGFSLETPNGMKNFIQGMTYNLWAICHE